MTTDARNQDTRSSEALRHTLQQAYGFVPNALDSMLVSPAVAALVLSAKKAMGNASLSETEQHAIELSIATRADCAYCIIWHAGLGERAGLAREEIARIRDGRAPSSARLSALLDAAQLVMSQGADLTQQDLARLAERGVSWPQVCEVIALVGLNVITNAINRISRTPPTRHCCRAQRRPARRWFRPCVRRSPAPSHRGARRDQRPDGAEIQVARLRTASAVSVQNLLVAVREVGWGGVGRRAHRSVCSSSCARRATRRAAAGADS